VRCRTTGEPGCGRRGHRACARTAFATPAAGLRAQNGIAGHDRSFESTGCARQCPISWTSEESKMTSETLAEGSLERDDLFRRFQLEKFKRNKSVPCVAMMMDLQIQGVEEMRHAYNSELPKSERITLTHVLIKAVAIALTDFPLLYGYFDGKKVIPSARIKINLPVSEGHHVEYVVIESPESKSLQVIGGEVRDEVERIRSGVGTFYLVIKRLFALPRLVRAIATNVPFISIRNAYKNYGNFPITNFGSFGAKIGIPIVSAPIICVLCLGMIQRDPAASGGTASQPVTTLPITIVFDHRPVDGAYCGRFLNRLKVLVETRADSIFK
jgi:pyruvate/2-oxoglutarate dehydrogenase complex dihydrolipoamide acyltransferase (E2) component